MGPQGLLDEHVLVRASGERGWTEIVLNRPERRNALTVEMVEQLLDALTTAGSAEVPVVLIRGEGPDLSTGFDLGALGPGDVGPGSRLMSAWLEVHQTLAALPAAVIALVHGRAWNAGAALALGADFVVADGDARFRLGEVAQGLAAPMAAGWLVAKHSQRAAARLLLAGEELSGAELVAEGVAVTCAPAGEGLAQARNLAQRLTDFPSRGVSSTASVLRAARPFAPADFERLAQVALPTDLGFVPQRLQEKR